jgi:hypothetical protein
MTSYDHTHIQEGEGRCDFCSTYQILWRYPARDFTMDVGPGYDPEGEGHDHDWGSDGDWAACSWCHDLIEAENRGGLAYRSAVRFAVEHEVPLSAILPRIADLHEKFWEHRMGPGVPVI